MFLLSGVTAGIAAHGSDEEGIGTMGPPARSTALEAFDVPSYHTAPLNEASPERVASVRHAWGAFLRKSMFWK